MNKILFTIDANTSGGAERVTSILANYFFRRGYEVSVINSDKDSCFYPLDNGIHLIKMGLDYNSGSALKRFLLKYRFIRNFIKKERPDIVVTFLFHMEVPTILASFSTGTRVFTSVRNSALSYTKIERTVRRILYPLIAGVVFQSDKVLNFHDFKRVKNKTVIMNPLSLEGNDESVVGYRDRRKWIINVGRLNNQKNQKLLLDAFALICNEFPDYTLHIFGTGDLKNELDNYIVKTGLTGKAILEGEVLNATSIYKDSYAFVLSSDFEGFPNALVEAMANGIPPISTDFDSGVAAELIQNRFNGFLCPVGDADTMAQRIREVLSLSEHEYMNMAENAKMVRNILNVDTIGEQWESFCCGSK